jgi:hypothetical protein
MIGLPLETRIQGRWCPSRPRPRPKAPSLREELLDHAGLIAQPDDHPWSLQKCLPVGSLCYHDVPRQSEQLSDVIVPAVPHFDVEGEVSVVRDFETTGGLT